MKSMKSMAVLAFAALLTTAFAFSSCEKDDDGDDYTTSQGQYSSGSSSGGGSTSGSGGSSGSTGGSGDSGTTITKTTAVSIQIVKVNGTFNEDDGIRSSRTIYKKNLYGKLYVYTDPACTNLLGTVERNTDRTRGGYVVSSYTYRISHYELFYRMFYYFD